MSKQLIKKDFVSDQEVRWCPGCGDYAILSAIQNTLPKIGKNKEDIVFISGIGCSSRLPYYVNSYGFHTIHGRALSISTGVKLSNPKLSVWSITGDGDSLAIGGNHFIHTLRRNVDLNILLFNNEIYGLTKGQFSPTSKQGIKTKSSPHGTVDSPFHVASVCFGAEASFFARTVDTLPKQLSEIFLEAHNHKGTSVVEILQNCVIFNDKTFNQITDKTLRDDHTIFLTNGKPMIYGKNMNKGIILDKLNLKSIEVNEINQDKILIHDANKEDNTLQQMLSKMHPDNGLPFALGVIRSVTKPTFDTKVSEQINHAKLEAKYPDFNAIVNDGIVWKI